MFMRTYKLTDEIGAYVTPEYTAFIVSNDGEILGIPNKVMIPGAQRSNAFEIEGKQLIIDYSKYSSAAGELRKISNKQDDDGNVIVENAEFLKEYYDGEYPETIHVSEAEHIFNNTIGNLLHIRTSTGVDELQILRILLAQLMTFALIFILYRKCKVLIRSSFT